MSAPLIAIATNNGDIGGGEVMLLNIAEALRELNIEALVIGPTHPGEVIERAQERGFRTHALRASSRPGYIAALARWRLQHRHVPLWCNGLVPSFATAGMGPRIVHLHIVPEGLNRLAARLGLLGARRVLVPSEYMASRVAGATVLPNWIEEIPFRPRAGKREGPLRIGFLGRLTRDKGVDVLAEAVRILAERSEQDLRLVLAGENRFGDSQDDAVIEAALTPITGRVEHLGWVDRAQFFENVDIAAFPAVLPEPFGLVAAESLAAGIPFVITDAGALPEVAGPRHPWIARRNDAADLARVIECAFEDILRGDGERAGSARERWEHEYSPQAGTARVAALLSDLSMSRGPRRKEPER